MREEEKQSLSKGKKMKIGGFRGYVAALSLLVLFSFASVGHATILPPGASVSPLQDFGAGFFFTSPIADTGALAFTATGSAFSGTLEEWVATDVNTGGLDFLYQVVNSSGSTDPILAMSVTGYSGFTTDVGYCSNPGGGAADPCGNPLFPSTGTNGTLAPVSADRTASGGTVDFNFSPVGIAQGVQTYDLVVETNATSFSSGGTANLIDGGVASVTTFAPGTTPVPEPSSFMLLGIGLVGFAFTGLTRRKQFVA